MTGRPVARETWDVFCRVVDNYGDIGIAWRLARQLMASGERDVRLIVDRLDVFARIEGRVDAARETQVVDGITIVEWSALGPAAAVAAVVVEVLGCGLPDTYLDAMAGVGDAVVWIDFEHLSAESWVSGFHGLPSPHPTRPLIKHFFYPGFGDDTGGLLIEPDLAVRRRAFIASPDAIDALWRRLRVPPPEAGTSRLAVFAYADAPWSALLAALANAGRWSVVALGAPVGVPASPDVHPVPFVGQDDFDRLLWACDAVFVRGEDSFVRAQAAGRPFVWQIYRQADGVHLTKLAAFLARYESGLGDEAAAAQRRLWTAWNERPEDVPAAARTWLAAMPELRRHAEAWRHRLASDVPLITRLRAFVDARRGSPATPGLLD